MDLRLANERYTYRHYCIVNSLNYLVAVIPIIFNDTRKKVNYKLMLLRKDNSSYEKYLTYQDYDLALNQVERMLDEIGEIFYSIKHLHILEKSEN